MLAAAIGARIRRFSGFCDNLSPDVRRAPEIPGANP
ncbi:hypothetical protein Ga0074812_12855 [Parafrankia irregularis]|uniref:Uncharacterized protein n=1 Tax=Parafrankia irregularis TaxID=795642 RepID=A0A0S4QX75_9ACTN|nr:hypothetical protein Ga0074812_12855 [Parafrankia irregularis]